MPGVTTLAGVSAFAGVSGFAGVTGAAGVSAGAVAPPPPPVTFIVQSQTFANINAIPTLASAPVVGNMMLILFSHWYNDPGSFTSWNQIYNTNGVFMDGMSAFYKYAGASESTTQSPIWNLSTESNGIFLEIHGLSGVAGTDILTSHDAVDVAALSPSFTTTPFNTAVANTMVIGMVWAGVAGTGTTEVPPTVTGGQTNIASLAANAGVHRNASMQFFQFSAPVSGTTVSLASTWPVTQTNGAWGMVSLLWPPP